MSAEIIPVRIAREGNSLIVSFRYHQKLVEQIKSLPLDVRRWDGVRKVWVVKQENLRQLLGVLKEARFEFVPEDLLEQRTTVRCFICDTAIDCRECPYFDMCPVKNEVTYCVCLDDMRSKHSFDLYSVEKARFTFPDMIS